MILLDHPLSGNCHKVRLFLSMLNVKYTSQHVDILSGHGREANFLEVNPLGQIPVLIDGEICIRDSQAILHYLASTQQGGRPWLPTEPAPAAHVQEWLAFAAVEIANGLQRSRVARLLPGHGEGIDLHRSQLKGAQVLGVLDTHLSSRDWLVGSAPTIADCACVPYVSMAAEAGLPLDDYNNVCDWLDRFALLPGFTNMPGMRGTGSLDSFGNKVLVLEWVDRFVSKGTRQDGLSSEVG